ncbi:Hypothetical predicted protein [Olea europaea subsp. europaea]|uniref:Uncharacterized protein n=1 Tax=Olea europaea subsp. europaea TaxID=158383 RepID=A0A8S0QX06_OLEEU|nr:Hypothetical predicted protein [Olea europaea subsp. europaea]
MLLAVPKEAHRAEASDFGNDDEESGFLSFICGAASSAIAAAAPSVVNLKMSQERLKKKSEGASEVLAWVDKSRNLKRKEMVQKRNPCSFQKIFEEQEITLDASRHFTGEAKGNWKRHVISAEVYCTCFQLYN